MMDSGAIFEAGDITINSYAEGISTLMSSGLYIQGTDTVADMGIVTIDSKTVGGESGDYVNTIGIRALNNGEINIAGGSIKAEAITAMVQPKMKMLLYMQSWDKLILKLILIKIQQMM